MQQGPKLRPIDDYSVSSINSTVGTHEQATTDNVDVIAAMLVTFMQQLAGRDRATTVVARSFDLSSAYRQLYVAETSRAFSYAVFDPVCNRPAIFRQICLPFGSRSAVNAFIRCARCIQWLACKGLYLPTTCYYDDFVVASIPVLANNSECSMSLLLDILGWKFDREGPKADSFSNCVTTLGVVIDLGSTAKGELYISNTEKRRNDSIELIEKVLTEKHLDKKSAQVLRGKLAFAYAQIFGMSGKLALQHTSWHAFRVPFTTEISGQLYNALVFLKERLWKNESRKISMGVGDHLVLLTDASFTMT